LVHSEWKAADEGMEKEEEGKQPKGGLGFYMGGKKEGRGGRTFGASVCRKD
jgi:hypothetical protein